MFDAEKRAIGCVVILTGCLAACQVEANAKVKSSGESSASASSEENVTAAAPAPAETAPPPAQPSSPPEGCPLSCFEAQGPTRVLVSNEEQAQLRTALEPVLGKMRACSSPEDWRRRGSPTMHLRVAPDGTLAEIGIDPQHGDTQCYDAAARGSNPTVSLPGRKTVRCVERCVAEPRSQQPRTRRRAR